ncbi:hypothetical protein PR048_004578 [Dryococelus australis]|uniref:HAT C-terminal dimerisation domain-containing protein n=1 Tax=Dryococelus australis TaxID=614101 RepID=A0ABQ9I7R4_9NEOP|nr:hypothetical protein PR048_004578 [Dryococelus australis]
MEKYPDGTKKIIQFPVPVLTRWNSWFKSVLYVSEYLTDMTEFFSLSEMQNAPNAGCYPQDRNEKTQIQAVFAQEHAVQLMSLIDSLEGSSYTTSHILRTCFAVAASGIFEPETTSLIEELGNKVLQAEVKQTLQRTASLSMDKLQEQISTDPCRTTFAVVDNLFNPSSVVLKDVNSRLVTSFQTLPGMKRTNLKSADIARSYTRFAEIVKAEAEKKPPYVVEVLLSMKHDFPDFVCAALRAVWLPCSNVYSERCFSSCSTIVTDRRHNLLEENTGIMTMLSFDQSR